jgi:hypothetical protein
MWNKVASLSAGATLGALAVVHFAAEARGQDVTSALRDEAPNRNLAESLVSRREAALQRTFDPIYRAQLVQALAALQSEELETLQSGGDEASLPNRLGDRKADLVYTPVTPCRVFDTREVGGHLVAGTARNFIVAAGSNSLASQGGNAAGCGVPMGPATSVMINLIAWFPSEAGNLRAWRVQSPQPPQPKAVALNYGPVRTLPALGNAIVVDICDPLASNCSGGDFRLQANLGSTDVVGDVVGYFSRFTKPVDDMVAFNGPSLPDSASAVTTLANLDFVPATTGTAVLFGRGHCGMKVGATADNIVVLFAGLSASEAASAHVGTMGVISVPPILSSSAGYAQAWSVQRELAVTAGQSTKVSLFARHPSGGSADVSCSGTFSVRTTF